MSLYDDAQASTALQKVAREGLGLVWVETELCPYVLARVLETITESGLIAFSIMARRKENFQTIEIELRLPGERAALVLLQRIRRIMAVRRASWAIPSSADAVANIRAKI